ncbi:carboxylesterase/lipase family protein [Mangrovimonas futianensis]|uniref:carboxylesterase/lipase family protein n=1 Tax=Mangrovimonas futianensis TaxID=2895523 RepID=UPI001E5E0ECC|nr:carboxylesterase family protein [Mangrovimonas futianensis]MCF1422896.1 carboxylesterase family protein [Mangrovimonas futianensis]
MRSVTNIQVLDSFRVKAQLGYFLFHMSFLFLGSLFCVLLFSCDSGVKNQERKNLGLETKSPELVQTGLGVIEGERFGSVVRFLGIPYAQEISGANRFAPPKRIKPWEGVLSVKQYADTAPQQAADPTSGSPVTPAFEAPNYVKIGDHCLALNIWKPIEIKEKLPVMVWLHGGGWTSGSGSCKIYDGENLAKRGDVIVVTINHRLGASGLTDFSRVIGGDFENSSNLGIRDIIAALEWVKDNIAAFGGDENLVTIFGESGGGWKVNTLLGVPSAKGLFHRAIVESGPLTRFLTPEEADEIAKSVLEELQIKPGNAEALNSISFQDVLKAEAAVMKKMPMSFQAPGFPTGFWPVIDGDIITEHVYDQEAAPSGKDVPLLIGQTGTEFTLFMLRDKAAYELDDSGLKTRIINMFGELLASKILQAYKNDFPEYSPSALWFRIFSDYAMGALSSEIMDVRSVADAAPVYAYRFNWQTPISDGKLYSPHTIEIPFVFDNVKTEAGIIMTGGGEEANELAKTVSSAWVEFAKTGKPSLGSDSEWPVYTQENRESMHIDIQSEVKPYMNPTMVELFHDILWERAGLKQ